MKHLKKLLPKVLFLFECESSVCFLMKESALFFLVKFLLTQKQVILQKLERNLASAPDKLPEHDADDSNNSLESDDSACTKFQYPYLLVDSGSHGFVAPIPSLSLTCFATSVGCVVINPSSCLHCLKS